MASMAVALVFPGTDCKGCCFLTVERTEIVFFALFAGTRWQLAEFPHHFCDGESQYPALHDQKCDALASLVFFSQLPLPPLA